MGLESLNENLPEIKIEMVFANKRLDFKPPLEQIRQSYYYEMKKFVAMPNTFEGIFVATVYIYTPISILNLENINHLGLGNSPVYKRMGPRNSKRLRRVFVKAEALFEKLAALLKRHTNWIRLGQVDLEQYVEANVLRPDDYIVNFKSLRSKKKDIDKLPDQEKVDCCTVSLTPFKGFLEDLLQQLGDTLLMNLRKSLLHEFKEVDEFLNHARERLSSRPHSVEEISNAKKEWKEIDSKKDGIKAISRGCMDKKKLLVQYAPGSAIDISEVTSKMANLDGEGG